MDKPISLAIVVFSAVMFVYFLLTAWRVWQSPEVKRDLERLREQRARRKAALR